MAHRVRGNLLQIRIVALCILISAASCSPSEPPSQANILPNPTATFTILPKPTQAATSTSTPSPTEIPKVDEHEIQPIFTEEVLEKISGVQIETSLIIDDSLDPVITRANVPKKAFAEVVAWNIYKVWRIKGLQKQTGPISQEGFREFLTLWAKAQSVDATTEDRERMVLNDIWANDLNDGSGYQQEPYKLLIMIPGEPLDGITSIKKISIIFVNTKRIKNITLLDEDYFIGASTNLDNDILLSYIGLANGGNWPTKRDKTTASANSFDLSCLWMIGNRGGSNPINLGIGYQFQYKKLLNSGWSVE